MSNRRVGRLALASLLVLPTALVAAGAGPDEGTAAGQLVVGGKQTALAHAYARAHPDPFDKTKERTVVVLSDVSLPPEEFLEQFPGLKLAAKGKAHIVTVELRRRNGRLRLDAARRLRRDRFVPGRGHPHLQGEGL